MLAETAATLESIVEEQLPLLKSVEDSWQPSDFLPSMNGEGWQDRVGKLREMAANLPDEVLVVLIGNLVTEEALPSYQTWLNRSDGLRDETGSSATPWGLWTKAWTAEEKRHGDLLSKYLFLTGRADMHSVEVTVQHLIRNGFNVKSDNDAYKSLVYASFQERATKISHGNVGRLAEKSGDPALAKICAAIAGDEARHEEAYKRIVGGVLKQEPSRVVLAFAEMMRQRIVMPARLMSDGTDCDLFSQFAIVAQRIGVYTTHDYADVIAHLVQFWDIPNLRFMSGQEAEAQDYICGLSRRYLNKAGHIQEVIANQPKERFAWIFDRSA